MSAKILWDNVPPETGPFSPENVLVFSTGLLTGLPLPGATRTSVNSINPQTDLFSHSVIGGFWGPELKFAGYDGIVIRGRSPDLVYIWINNDRIEIRDASRLRGKGSRETTAIIREELKQEKAQVAAIGLAGENRVCMATIDHGYSSASRMVGVTMGDKKLKAIAVRGTGDLHVAQPAELFATCSRLRTVAYNDRALEEWAASMYPASSEIQVDRKIGCYNCPKNCTNVISPGDNQLFTYKCFAKDSYQFMDSREAGLGDYLYPVAREYGLDSFSTPEVITFALKLLEAGIVTEKDFPGIPSATKERYLYLIEMITRREGIGDVLADGVYAAAHRIGKGAEAFETGTVKKLEQVTVGMDVVAPHYFLMTVTGEKLSLTGIDGSFPVSPLPTPEEREKFVADWDAVPDERFKRYVLDWNSPEELSGEAACAVTDWNETMHYIDDSLGLCAYMSSFRSQLGGGAIYHIHSLPRLVNLVTGLELDENGLWEIARRNRNLVRAINVRRGMRRKDETLPASQRTHGGHESEQKLLDEYYKFKGWNRDGIPTRETLDILGLEYVTKDFEQRGIFPE